MSRPGPRKLDEIQMDLAVQLERMVTKWERIVRNDRIALDMQRRVRQSIDPREAKPAPSLARALR
jgi:hypothetical protein